MQDLIDGAKRWLFGKTNLASRLASGECGGSYGDAVLVLSSIISGIAAELWPGEGFDRKRFVEVWVRYADPQLHANRVSLPLLVEALRKHDEGTAERARLLRPDCISDVPFLDTLVVTGNRVDVAASDVEAALPDVSRATIRGQTYGSIFYRYFRSGYVHEYKAGSHGDEVVMSSTRGDITYSNWDEPPYRRINFNAGWLTTVVESICEGAVKDYWEGAQARPATWWLDG